MCGYAEASSHGANGAPPMAKSPDQLMGFPFAEEHGAPPWVGAPTIDVYQPQGMWYQMMGLPATEACYLPS